MKVGVSLSSSYATRDVRAGAHCMVERAKAAAEAGLDSLFVGDHHAMPAPYYQNTAILGRLLAEWDERPAGCLFLVPLWNPVLLAEQVGTLASIARGRFIMQCALGAGAAQFDAMGVSEKQRPSRFEDGLAVIRALLAGEKVTSEGRYRLSGVRIAPIPPEPVDVWIGGSAEASVERAARLGDGYLAGPELTLAQAAHWATFYREKAAALGRSPGALVIRRDVHVGESDAAAAAVAEPIIAAGYRGFDPSACVFGSPETVAARFREFAAMGYGEILVRHMSADQQQVLGSFRRLREVRAAVRDA